MSGRLCLLCSEVFRSELEAVIAAEGWDDVSVASFDATCGEPLHDWEELHPLLDEACEQVLLLGNDRLKGLGEAPEGWPLIRTLPHGEYFELVAGASLVRDAAEQGAYIVTPGWLVDWRDRLRQLGFDEASASEFFHDIARELLLLDTGVDPAAEARLKKMAETLDLPARRIAVGLDYIRQLIGRAVAEWRHDELLRQARENEHEHKRELVETEEAYRKSEYSLRIAQSIAHLGHWEWDVQSGQMHWSDETYRILGYQPQAILPSQDDFLLVIHPDDRARVAEHINQAQQEGGFNLEYKIVLPDGQVRIVHGMGSVIFVGSDKQPRLLGAIRDVTGPGQTEVLGVIQDITERKELEWKLAQEARTDVLTGCANRRYFMELARHELARVRRYGGELSLLLLDVDHFKSINDRFGHQAGDQALQRLVQICRHSLREEDVVGRTGGEEFVILLPETSGGVALEVAERLRLAVASAEMPLENREALNISVSIGVATLASWEADIDNAIARADAALYEAKRAGRNRVEVAAEEAPLKVE